MPFYIAAPTQTLDPECPDGSRIPIEERASSELTHFQGCQVAAPGIQVRAMPVPANEGNLQHERPVSCL